METEQHTPEQAMTKKKKQRKIKEHLETNKTRNTAYKNLWDAIKAVLRGKFIVTKSFTKKLEGSQISNLTFHHKELGKMGRLNQMLAE